MTDKQTSDYATIAVSAAPYKVWDRTVRVFHWLNVICILGLMAIGIVLLNGKSLGISLDGKILLKTIHVYIGYVFVLNLIWRIVWGFIGSKHARWRSILPFKRGAIKDSRVYLNAALDKKPLSYAGHNPLAKFMVTLLFVLLITQASTGLILAGTDLYLPPFGHEIAEHVTNAGEDHSKLEQLKAGSKQGVDAQAYAQMREYRKPIINLHVLSFYALLISIVLHIVAVVVTELTEKSNLVSAMITGEKLLKSKPLDDHHDSQTKP